MVIEPDTILNIFTAVLLADIVFHLFKIVFFDEHKFQPKNKPKEIDPMFE